MCLELKIKNSIPLKHQYHDDLAEDNPFFSYKLDKENQVNIGDGSDKIIFTYALLIFLNLYHKC